MAQAKTHSSHSGSSSSSSGATIGSSTRVRGKISGEGDLTVEGHVEGEIALRGDLTIASGGSVTSDVDANDVSVSGTLEGDVNASGDVHIVTGARVRGDVKGAQIAIDDGAQFAGRLDCDFDLPPELEPKARGAR
jgi:cytoskeletal protein CcmA (bactofilin family)